ncbi:MAG: hypothetical protein GIX03_01370 [Candidatus Eremiobacteraeota bacterium]|nr:hypothetical protein [Candidatus Eremiobacteraeota bacterium]
MTRLRGAARRRTEELYRRYRRHRDYRFILYASPRTCSTSLSLALNGYLGIRCAIEPFSADSGGNVRDRVCDLPSLKREVARLWCRYNGLKHIWKPNGFPFEGQPGLNDYLLTAATDRVVLLNRRNALQRIVSWQIAAQADVFHVWKDADRTRLLSHRFQPLDKNVIEKQLINEREAVAAVQGRLDELGRPYKMLWYEDLFGNGSRERMLNTLGNVIAFITGRPFQPKLLKKSVLELLDSTNPQMKVNSLQTYELVPNIREIEDQLGCDETGYLFR